MENIIIGNQSDYFTPSGFKSFDEELVGFRSSCLYTLAGAAGMGKTTLGLSFIKQIIDKEIPVGIFSYEMTETQIIHRLIAMESDVAFERISTDRLAEYEYQMISKSVDKLSKLPIFIDTSARLKINELALKAKELKIKEDIKFLFIDDIQRIPIDDFSREYASNREQEISANVRELKRLARELNIPILAISQLNRMLESRGGDRRPILSDLRDSGAIENDSDVVLFLYRPEYYGFLQDDDGYSNVGKAEIIIAKNRHGQLNIVNLLFESKIPIYKNIMKSNIDNTDVPSVMSSFEEGFDLGADDKIPF